jgi:hypothetical protein
VSSYPYVPAKHHGGYLHPTAIVIHDMEAPEKSTTALSTAHYFQTMTRPASAHYCIDDAHIIQCVQDNVQAYHAPPANSWALGFEHAGYANQTAADWSDAFSTHMLLQSVGLAAEKCKQYGIQPVFLRAEDLRAGRRNGITTHLLISQVFRQSTHTDPGPNFPINQYIFMVAAAMGALRAPTAPSPMPGPLPPMGPEAAAQLQQLQMLIYGTKVEASKKPFDLNDTRTDGVKMIQAGIDRDPICHADGLYVEVDGAYGPYTKDAVKWFQARHGLVADGIAGANTLNAMYP